MSQEIHLQSKWLNVPFIHFVKSLCISPPQTLPISQKPRTLVSQLVRRASWAVKPLRCLQLNSSGSKRIPGTLNNGNRACLKQSWWITAHMDREWQNKGERYGRTERHYSTSFMTKSLFRTRNQQTNNHWRKLGSGQNELTLFENLRLVVDLAILSD